MSQALILQNLTAPSPRQLARYICTRLVVSLGSAGAFSFFLSPLLSQEFVLGQESNYVTLLAFGPVVIAPLMETFLLLVGFVALSRLNRWAKQSSRRDWVFAFLLGLAFASLHGIVDWIWGVIVVVPGIVFSKALVDWSAWHSRRLGFFVSAAIHILHNIVAFVLIRM